MTYQKYRAVRTTVDGITFDSKKEAARYELLRDMEEKGLIKGLQLQVPYVLIPRQYDDNGNLVERACIYKADFVYIDCGNGEEVVEDVKGMRLPAYKIKKKLMRYMYGIAIKEV